MELAGRVAVVTGAGTGIGRAIALELSRRGAAVGLIGRTRATLEAVAGEAKGEACVATADVSERASVDAACDAIRARLGPLHAVVANAGVGGPERPRPRRPLGRDRPHQPRRRVLHAARLRAQPGTGPRAGVMRS